VAAATCAAGDTDTARGATIGAEAIGDGAVAGGTSMTRLIGCASAGAAATGAAAGAIGFPHLLQKEATSGLGAPQELQNIVV